MLDILVGILCIMFIIISISLFVYWIVDLYFPDHSYYSNANKNHTETCNSIKTLYEKLNSTGSQYFVPVFEKYIEQCFPN